MSNSLPNEVYITITDSFYSSGFYTDISRFTRIYPSYRRALIYLSGIKAAAILNGYRIKKIPAVSPAPTGRQKMYEIQFSDGIATFSWAIIRIPIEKTPLIDDL